ncbi:MAG: hypothetical protein H7840_12190 [Alphaproteobacteria bacterium]
MADALLNQVQKMLTDLSGDVEQMTTVTRNQVDTLMGALDDIAAHTLAVQAILIQVMKTTPVDKDAVLAWVRDQTKTVDPSGEGTTKSLALAEFLITGRKP